MPEKTFPRSYPWRETVQGLEKRGKTKSFCPVFPRFPALPALSRLVSEANGSRSSRYLVVNGRRAKMRARLMAFASLR